MHMCYSCAFIDVLMYLLKDANGLWMWTSEHTCLYGKSH